MLPIILGAIGAYLIADGLTEDKEKASEGKKSEDKFEHEMYAKGGNIVKGKKYIYEFTNSKTGLKGYDVIEITDTKAVSKKMYFKPVVQYKIVESDEPSRVGKIDETTKEELNKMLKNNIWSVLNDDYLSVFAEGGMPQVNTVEVIGVKKNIMGTASIIMKLKGMKKPQDFIVYPKSSEEAGKPTMIQSDTRIGLLDLNTGRGIMSQSHSNGAYGYHLAADKKVAFMISEKDLQLIKDEISKTRGSKVGSNGVFSDNSGA